MIKGEVDYPGLVCCSIYYRKPVHFLTMYPEEIEWITKEIDVYGNHNHTQVAMESHCKNIQEE